MRNISTTEVEIKIIEYVFTNRPCPGCGAESKRHSIGHRMLKDLSLEQPVLVVVTMGVYKCPTGCRPKYFRVSPPIAGKKSAYTNRVKEVALASVQEDQMRYCGVESRMERDFGVGPSTSSVWRWCLQDWEQIDLETEYEPWVVKRFSGVLCVDEAYDGPFCVILLRDGLNEMTLYEQGHKKEGDQQKGFCQSQYIQEGFQYIQKLGLAVEVVSSDGDPMYPALIAKHFPEARQQRCHFHVLQAMTPCVLQAVNAYTKQLKTQITLPRGRPRAEDRERVQQAKRLREAAKQIQKQKHLIVMHPKHLPRPDGQHPHRTRQEALDQMLSEHPALQVLRQFMEEVFATLSHGQTIEQARMKYRALVSNATYQNHVNLAKALGYLSAETFQSLMTFLDYENLNRTNNAAERGFRRFRKRQKSHYRLRRQRTIQAWFKADRRQEQQRQQNSGVEPKRLTRRPAEKEKKAA